MTKLIKLDLLFETTSILGKKVRTHVSYWQKIKLDKHPESEFVLEDLKIAITEADTVYQSNLSSSVYLYCKKLSKFSIIVVVRHLDGDGFVITA